MTQADTLYRAIGGLKKELAENRPLVAFASSVANAAEPDSVVVVHNVCHVEEDWIAAIERGLVFIGKALEEDRQFIRSNGDVQPIEKVRHISKESVVHLSRHSDLITREPKEDIIPDKLYTVERLSDYTVYENRFLYLLLTRIKDFVGYRQEAIARAFRTYRGEYTAKKRVITGTRRFTYEFTFVDEQEDAPSNSADEACQKCLSRMEKIQQSVAFFLRTPIMTEVARVDKIKNKITKTNVLRMDKNFKETVALYEFLLAYGRDGYSVERVETKLAPVPEAAAKELALPPVLAAFLVYEHGLGLGAYLQEEFEKEEAFRAEQAQKALVEAIRDLKKRIEETGEGMEQYMLLLEERNAALERDSKLLAEARAEIETLHGNIEALQAEQEVLKSEIEELNAANDKLREDMERAAEEHKQKLEELRREAEAAEAAHAEEVAKIRRENREEIARVTAEFEAKVREETAKIAEKGKETERVRQELVAARKELASSMHECEVLGARLTAFRKEHGLLTDADDFTTEAGFNALEHEFEVLGKLVREEWTNVKKILKKEFYGSIRATVHKKKGVKSSEYKKLSAESQARRPRAVPEERQETQPQPAAEQENTDASEEEGDIGKVD